MEFLLFGIFTIVVGVSWIRGIKREGDMPFIRAYKGVGSLIAGVLLVVIGLLKISKH